jgi:7-cyano-7-deazaguanine synthase in queuosine biosynthesis
MSAAAKLPLDQSPHARFEVAEAGGRSSAGTIRCVINKHFAIDAGALSAYCFRELPRRADDLVAITAGVAFADRTVARQAALMWRRSLELSVPVHDVDFWRRPEISASLQDLLTLLTGDTWTLSFYRRRKGTPTELQEPLPLAHGAEPVVMPFSDGLDSLAGARLTAVREAEAPLILVTAGQRNDADREWRERYLNARRYRLVLPFRFLNTQSGHRFRESSYRTRALVYSVMAGIAAHLSGATRIVYAESGQGSLGPWLVPVGNEAPDVRMHPLFTRRVAAFLAIVLETPLKFEHPYLWQTKGETLRELVELELTDDWNKTRSCARDARHMSVDGQHMQCGVCAGCLLRRQSLLAAGLDETSETSPYFWNDLKARTLTGASFDKHRTTTLDDERQAVCGFLSLSQLSDLAHPNSCAQVAELANQLADTLGETETKANAKLERLLDAHRAEWKSFLDRLGPDSFLARWMRERQ